MASCVDRNCKFSERIFQLLQYSCQRPSFFKLTGLLWWQKLSLFSTIFFKICRFIFAVEFCFRCKYSSLGKRLDGLIFLDQSHFFATNSSQSWDCFILFRRYIIPNGYFRFRQSGQMPAFELCWKILKQKKRFICISLFVIATNRFHVVVHLFTEDVKMW